MHAADAEVLFEVVVYDPIARKGFLRAAEPRLTGRVHFVLGVLPEGFKRPIIDRSKPINSKRTLSPEMLASLVRELRRSVIGVRLRARVRTDERGRRHLVKRSVGMVVA